MPDCQIKSNQELFLEKSTVHISSECQNLFTAQVFSKVRVCVTLKTCTSKIGIQVFYNFFTTFLLFSCHIYKNNAALMRRLNLMNPYQSEPTKGGNLN